MGKKKDKAAKIAKALKREREIEAELARRAEEAKASKKKAKKKGKAKAEKPGKKKGKAKAVDAIETVDAAALGVMTVEAEAPIAPEPEAPAEEATTPERHPHLEHLDRIGELAKIVADPEAKPKKKAKAEAELATLRAEGAARIAEKDAELREKIRAKREAREAEAKAKGGDTPAVSPDAHEGESEPEYQMRKKREKAEARATSKVAEAVDAVKHAVEVVETEVGREFVAGEAKADADEITFAKPSDNGGRPDFETNGNNQYLISRPSDGKLVGYTRATTYIACLEDTSKLTEWKLRILLEGAAHDDAPEIIAKIRDLAHVRDTAIAKARRSDRKGKLGVGDLKTLVDRAWAEFKKSMNALADEVFEIGGGREKATKGTDIHALTELHDRDGITAVGDLLTDGKITPADMADVEAYADAMRKLGAKIVERERVVVNDELKVAGRLDIVAMVKLPALHDPKTGDVIRPAEARARRRVIDVKTGKIEYGIGKLAQQLEMYAGSTGYDLETHEREDLKLDRTVGLVIHLPAGSGKATVHVVDLTLGRKGNKLAGDVRSWRNEGKRAANLSIDVLAEIDRAESEAE